jgi:hypothetical protein
MRRAQPATVTLARTWDAPALPVEPGVSAEPQNHPVPTPSPPPRAAERIRDALLRWLEEDM